MAEPPPIERLRSRIGTGQYTPLRVPNLTPAGTPGAAGPAAVAVNVAAGAPLLAPVAPVSETIAGLSERRGAVTEDTFMRRFGEAALDAIDAAISHRLKVNVWTQLKEMQPLRYLLLIFLFGIGGIMAGVGVEALIDVIPNDQDSSPKCFGILAAQIAIDAFLILILSLVLGLYVDKIIVNSWAGFLFGVTFFVGQTSLTDNCRCAFRMALK